MLAHSDPQPIGSQINTVTPRDSFVEEVGLEPDLEAQLMASQWKPGIPQPRTPTSTPIHVLAPHVPLSGHTGSMRAVHSVNPAVLEADGVCLRES